MRRPPRIAEWILGRLLPAAERDEVQGDLAEAYQHRSRRGSVRARLWYLTQVLLVPAWMAASAVRTMRFDGGEARRIVRGLLRQPAFTTMAVLSLGLGIGATTAMYGVLESLLLRTLPVDRPDEIRLVYHSWPEQWERGQFGSSSTADPEGDGRLVSNVSFPAWEVLEAARPADVGLAAWVPLFQVALVDGDAPAVAVRGMLVSGGFFRTVGLELAAGRALTPADDRPGATPVVVLSHALWQRSFGGASGVLGRTIRLNGRPFEVVGIAERDWIGLSPGGLSSRSDLLVPLSHAADLVNVPLGPDETLRTAALHHWVRLIARVPRGLDAEALMAEWTGPLATHMVEAGVILPEGRGDMRLHAFDGARGLDGLRPDTQRPVVLLGVVAALVLLIACANLTTILLARGVTRSGELALRRAIGASRWELARPQIVESLVLSGTGGVLGLFVADRAGPLVVASLTGGAGTAGTYRTSWTLAAIALGAALLAAVLSGLIPAVRQMRADPADRLGTRGPSGHARLRLSRSLIALQIAISVPLVVGAGLFLRTLGNIVSIDPGFDAEGLVVFHVDASLVAGDLDAETGIYQQILEELRRAPGVRAAALVENVLVSGSQSNGRVRIEGYDDPVMMDWNAMSPGFFETMGVPQRSGRPLADADDDDAPPVVLVNETAERALFEGRAVGRRIQVGDRNAEIVGVVADTRYSGLRDQVEPALYDPWRQRPGGLYQASYVARVDGPTTRMEPVIRRIVADAHPGLPATGIRTQRDDLEAQARRERVFARLLTAFGAFALLLSSVGLYGLMSFSVAQRRAEMGVRLALGAAPRSIVSLVLRQVAALTAIGLAIGLLVAVQLGPAVRALLFGVEPDDGIVLAIAAIVMAAVALIAGAVPALRASRVDPLKSLAS